MTWVIASEPVQTPDICLSWAQHYGLHHSPVMADGLLSNNRPDPHQQWPAPATSRALTHFTGAGLLPRAPHSAVLFLVFSRFLSASASQLSFPGHIPTLTQDKSCVLSLVRYPPPLCHGSTLDASNSQGSGGFHDPRVALLEWTLDFCRDIASSALNPARVLLRWKNS